jgi:hypothetical protein
MTEYYVIATRYDGKVVVGFKRTPIQFERNAFWDDPIFGYPSNKPNRKKPILFKTRESAEKRREIMSLNQGTYVRKARPKEMHHVVMSENK